VKLYLSTLLVSLLISFNVKAQPSAFTLNTWLPATERLNSPLLDPQQLISAVFKQMNMELLIVNKPAERSIREANSGIADGEFMRISNIHDLYPNLIKVSPEIGQMNFVVFSKLENIDLSAGWQGLTSYKIGYVMGWKIIEKNIASFKHTFSVGNAATLFSILSADRFDVIIYEQSRGLKIIKQLGIMNVNAKLPALSSQKMYLFLHKKHQKLVPQISQTINAIKAKAKIHLN